MKRLLGCSFFAEDDFVFSFFQAFYFFRLVGAVYDKDAAFIFYKDKSRLFAQNFVSRKIRLVPELDKTFDVTRQTFFARSSSQ